MPVSVGQRSPWPAATPKPKWLGRPPGAGCATTWAGTADNSSNMVSNNTVGITTVPGKDPRSETSVDTRERQPESSPETLMSTPLDTVVEERRDDSLGRVPIAERILGFGHHLILHAIVQQPAGL